MSEQQKPRWSDERLEQFHAEFREHRKIEDEEHMQQREMYEALFRQEDKDKNIGPGIVQLMARLDERTKAMEIAADRQKRFVGGVMFAFTCMGFLFTDSAHKLLAWLRSI